MKTVQLVQIDVFLKALLVNSKIESPAIYKTKLKSIRGLYTQGSLIDLILGYVLDCKALDLQSALNKDFILNNFLERDNSIVQKLLLDKTNIQFNNSTQSYLQVIKLIEELNLLFHKKSRERAELKLKLNE